MTREETYSHSLKELIKAACQPDEGRIDSYEMGTEAWEEWTKTRSHAKDRRRAAKKIKLLGPTAVDPAVDTLIEVIDGGESGVQTAAAAESLGMIGSARAVSALIRHIEYSGEPTGEACADALAKIGEQAVVPLLQFLVNQDLSLFDYGGDLGSRCALRALGKIADRRTLEPLSLIFKSVSASTRDKTEPDSLYNCVRDALRRIDPRPRTLFEKLTGRRPWAC